MNKRILFKIFVGILIVTCLFAFFAFYNKSLRWQRVETMKAKYDCTFSLVGLDVFCIDNTYVVTIHDQIRIERTVHFFSDRTVKLVENLCLIEDASLESYKGETLTALEEGLGNADFDVASGFFAPAYITDDAFLWIFYIEQGIVSSIVKYDLILGKQVAVF